MLLEDLKNLAKRAEIAGCVVNIWVSQQDEEVKQLIDLLAKNPNVNLTEALNVLRKNVPDLPFKRTAFVSHMRGSCTCHQA